jgi:hypothetical protein
MSERDLCKNIIDFSFLIKSQLKSDETSVLRSLLTILIMEAEDTLSDLNKINEHKEKSARPSPSKQNGRTGFGLRQG